VRKWSDAGGKTHMGEHFMTVGIGVACQRGQCVVMAADQKGSFANDAFPPHERIGKQSPLPFGLCGNVAGPLELCNAIMNRVATALETHPRNWPLSLDYVQTAVEAARFAEFKRLVDEEMKANRLMTLEEWQQLPEPSLQYRRGQRIINRTVLPAELLVGGIIMGSGTVIHVGYMQKAKSEALACIGSGSSAAFRRLMERSQNAYMSLPRTILHIAEGMQQARLEEPETVGNPANYVVITEKQTRRMPAKDPTLQQLLAKYADMDTEEIDSSNEVWDAIQAALYVPGISKEQYEQGIRAPQSRHPGSE
jgi:hypothetical protein